ncbi:MAG: hypothetical protein JWN38_990 [Candidatus Saccharibacteria bacterium]|nr:hypothetical protein [Candidatus Saccharibacteria bacterium]
MALLAITLLVLILYVFIWPTISKAAATAHLKQVSNQQMQPLLQPINALMQGVSPSVDLECNEVSHTHTKTQLYCQNVNVYTYNSEPLSDSSRSRVVTEASLLDKTLVQNGWTADRPQDKIKTVAASIPTTSLQPLHTDGVPFHKNIGNISCNLEVTFSGPSDGISPGAINVNQFSCQQNISYFMLHPSSHVNRGFGP